MKKNLLSLLLFIVLPNLLWAQWQIANSNLIGGSGDEDFNDVQAIADGYIAVGFTSSSQNGDITQASQGLSDYWVVKLDFEGNIVWQKTYGGLGNDIATAIEPTQEGNFWIFGTIDSSGANINQYLGGVDAWGILIDSEGELLNEVSFGGSQNDFIYDIAKNNKNELYLVGETTSTNGNISNAQGNQDGWLLIMNENGDLQQSLNFGGSKKEGFNAISYEAQNDIFYIGGYTNSNDGTLSQMPQSPNLKDAWLLAFQGNVLTWQTLWGGNNAEIVIDICVLDNKNIAFCAETTSSDIEGFKGNFDIATGVFAPNGTLIWAKAYGGSAGDSPLQITQNADKNLAILAFSNSIGGDIGFGYQNFNIWLAEIDANNGNMLQNQILGGNSWDFGSAFIALPQNGYFLLANTDSFDGDIQNGGGKNAFQPIDGNHDVWVAILKTIASNDDAPIFLPPAIEIYPNPAQNFIFCTSPNAFIKTLQCYNTAGQLMLETANTNTYIDISHLATGNYWLKIGGQDERFFYKKLVILR